MAPRLLIAVALVASAHSSVLRGPGEAQLSADYADSGVQDAQTDGFFSRNMPWLATVPYVQGKVTSLARRMDLSVLFPDEDRNPQNFASLVPADGPKPIDHEKVARDMHPDRVAKRTSPEGLARSSEKMTSAHPVLDKEGKVKDSDAVLASVLSTASTLVLWIVFVVAAAFFYRNFKDISEVDLDKAKGVFQGKPFQHGPFDCFEDMDVCCWSCWCGAVQWSDTMGAAGIMSFWIALLVFVSIGFVNLLSGILVWLLVALVFTYFRQTLRRQLQMQNENEDMVKDLAMWCCCQCCAIVQEARQIKVARKLTAPTV